MNKHTEAIMALEPFAAILDGLEDLAQSCSVSSFEETEFTVPIRLSDLLEATRVLKEWNKKHSHPVLKPRLKCKTCGILNYYENLLKGRCPSCEDEMRVIEATEGVARIKESKKVTMKKMEDPQKNMAVLLRSLTDEELEEFFKSVSIKDAVLYRTLLKKF